MAPAMTTATSTPMPSATTIAQLELATIERVWLDTTDVQRGKAIPVKILLGTWRGEKIVRTVAVEIPRNAEGPLTLLVAAITALGALTMSMYTPSMPAIAQALGAAPGISRLHSPNVDTRSKESISHQR